MRRWILVVALIAALGGCGGDGDERTERVQTGGGGGAETQTAPPGRLDFDDLETVAQGLEVPWGLAFAGDGRILVTERAGRVRLVSDGELQEEPLAELDVVANGESGLMGIALHPEFPGERVAYLYYTAGDGNRLSRFELDSELRFGNEEVLLTAPSAAVHDGGRIAFGPDGLLYATTGDAGDPPSAADRDSLAGKILRVRPDGEAPPGNPFGSPVFSYGHRNPQGLAWDPDGRLYAAEHGPTGEDGLCCHDELNLVERGGFYGWPFAAGEVDALSGEPPADPVGPVAASGEDTWAPAGAAVVDAGDGRRDIFVATLRAERLLRFRAQRDDPGSVSGPETALEGFGRLRAAALGPDDCLYLTTSNTDGRGQPQQGDDRILRACRS